MKSLRGRVERMAAPQGEPHSWEVWFMDDAVCTNEAQHPGRTFTEREMDALPLPDGWGRIVVVYVDVDEPAQLNPDDGS